MKRFCTLFFLTFGLLLLLSVGVSAETRTAFFYNGNTVVATKPLQSGFVTLADAPDMGTKQFVGWALTTGDTETLYHAGSSFSDPTGSGDPVFHAVGVELDTLTGAAVTLDAPNLLRFDGTIPLADYNRLVSLLGKENVTPGILIAPYTEITGSSYVFDLGCDAEGLLNRTASDFLYSTETLGVFCGITDAIPDDALLEKYAARAYLSLTFGGKTVTLYATYSPTQNVRSVFGVTAFSFEDRTDAADAKHGVMVETGCYSHFSTDDLALLRKRLDKVIYVSMSGDGNVESRYSLDNIAFFEFHPAHYVSPYRVERVLFDEPTGYDTYVITAAEGADFNTVTAYFIGGSYRRPDRASEWRSDGIYISVRNRT